MIEIGEYIRTDKGIIFELQRIDDDFYMWGTNYKGCYEKDIDIKAHSKNIIDLIEVGDYVNGIRIDKKFAIKTNLVTKHKYLEYNYGFENVLNDFEIKTILTHEQYEQNCYKVGDIE